MLAILVGHELMLTRRLTLGYDAELYRVNGSGAGCRGYQNKQTQQWAVAARLEEAIAEEAK
jgi:hypothetical protein